MKEIRLVFNGKALQSNTVMLSKEGVLWLGGPQGIFSYNGYSLKQIYSANRQAKEITTLYQDSSGDVWAGTKGGNLLQFKNQVNIFSNLLGKGPKTAIKNIVQDRQKVFWIATEGEGLFALANSKWIVCAGLVGKTVNALSLDNDGNIMAGTNQGLYFAGLKDSIVRIIKTIKKADGLPSDNILSLLYQDNLMAIGFKDAGAVSFNMNNGKMVQMMDGQTSVTHLCKLNKELWLGTTDHGIYNYNISTSGKALNMNLFETLDGYSVQSIINTPYHYQLLLINHKLYVTQGDWLGKIAIPAEIMNSEPEAIAVNKEQLIAVYNSGVFTRTLQPGGIWHEVKLPANIKADEITSIVSDRLSKIWIGTAYNGIFLLDANFKLKKHYALGSDLIDNNIFRLVEFNGTLAYGCKNGIGFINTYTGKPMSHYANLINQKNFSFVYDISITPDSVLWLATDGNGIIQLKKNAFKVFLGNHTKEKKIVYCLSGNNNNEVWYSSMHPGLFELNRKANKPYNVFENMNYSMIHAVITDKFHHVVTVHDDFLSIFDPLSRQQYSIPVDFDFGAGRGNNNLVSYYQGNYYIISNKGIYIYKPDGFAYMNNLKSYLTAVNVNLQPLDNYADDKIVLAYNENNLNIELISPWLVSQEKVKYQYVIVGLNKDTVTTSDNSINLPNLLPGRYVLKVRPIITGAVLNTEWTEKIFVIHKPWYKAWWFIMLIALLLSFLLFIVNRLYLRYKNRENEIERQRLKQEIRILNNQINPHFLFNSLNNLISIIDIDKENAKVFTENLADFYRLIVTYKDNYVISLAEDLKIAGIYIALQNTRFADAIHYKTNVPDKYLKCFVPPLTLQILLENAIKHNKVTRNQPLQITVEIDDKYLKITNQINAKENMEISTGSGIKFIIDRFNFITRSAPFIVKNDKTFTINVPLVFEEPFPV